MPPLSTQESPITTIGFGLGQSQSYSCQPMPIADNATAAAAACSSSRTTSLLCTSNPPTTKKRVMFHEVVKAKRTIHISDFTPAETEACWYSARYLRHMKKDTRYEARILEDECMLVGPSRSIHLLGMDVFTPKGSKQRYENKKRSQALVLEEQYLQKEEGSHDPDFIAQIYRAATWASRLASIEAARV